MPPARREVTTGTDGVVPFERVGRVLLPGLGSLDVWWLATYGGGVFLPVRDASSGRGSYGGSGGMGGRSGLMGSSEPLKIWAIVQLAPAKGGSPAGASSAVFRAN